MQLELQSQFQLILKHMVQKKVEVEKIYELINNNFDLRPAAIISKLNLKTPIYTNTSSYGHFGKGNGYFRGKFWIQLNYSKINVKLTCGDKYESL